MLSWARRHTPEAILIPAALSAFVATALSNVPEVVPFGHELGLGAMGLGYSYVVAYTFNLLAVELPRARQLRAYYAASRGVLTVTAFDPALLVLILSTYCDSDPEVEDQNVYTNGAPEGTICRMFISILDLPPPRKEELTAELLRFRDDANTHYQQLAALFSQFEPQISVAIAALRPDPMVMALLENPMPAIRKLGILVAPHVVDYQRAGRRLSLAMRGSPYMPTEPAMIDPPLYPDIDSAND